MKRLIPASVIFVLMITLCIVSHITVKKACFDTLKIIEEFNNQKITALELESKWQSKKEKMSLFVNHAFLDDLTIYIGQLTLNDSADERNQHIYKEITTILSMIQEEQKLTEQSFY